MPLWKAPNRPKHEITQSYNDGVVTIYRTEDIARPGYKPAVKLTKKVSLRYEEQRLGIQRYYAALQNQIKVSRVIRCPKQDVTTQDIAVTEDGRQYRIDLVQTARHVWPASIDLTLTAVKQRVEVTP